MTYEELITELVRLRKAKGWTMQRLANEMQTSESHVDRLEKFKVKHGRRTTLQRWCNALGKHYYYGLEDA